MRCQIGDLAFIRSGSDYERRLRASGYKGVGPAPKIGTIIRVVRYYAREAVAAGSGLTVRDIWEVDPPLFSTAGTLTRYCPDEMLTPIRDEPGEDESLRWASVPKPTAATIPSRSVEFAR